MLFILSILAFVASILPFYGKLSLNDPSSIRHTRKISLLTKYVSVLVATGLFLGGMGSHGICRYKARTGIDSF